MKRAIAVLLLTSFLPVPAHAADAETKRECVQAHEEGQVARKDGHLTAARESFASCARDVCPALVRKPCVTWLEEVKRAVPTVVVRVQDARGDDVTDVRVTVDGHEVAKQADGRPIDLDPGQHALVVERGDAKVEQRLLVVQGEKDRLVNVRFDDAKAAAVSAVQPAPLVEPPPTADHKTSRPTPTGVYALTAIGILGIGAFGVLGGIAYKDENDLRNSCGHRCAPDDVDAVSTKYHVADAALTVGVVALGAALTWFLLRPSKAEPRVARRW